MSENAVLTGLLLFIGVILPVLLIRDIRQKRRIREILNSYINKDPDEEREPEKDPTDLSMGWGMNNSPFRRRRSGLQWGGGNIKASEARRGERRSFRKK
jgi:hypothetical protein